jgi:hypothetical protein
MMAPRHGQPADESDTLPPGDRLRAHVIADRVIEIIEERHGVEFHMLAEVARRQQQEETRRRKFTEGAALTILAALLAAAFGLATEILRHMAVLLGGGK